MCAQGERLWLIFPKHTGALVGPPWSKRENGFIFSENAPGGISLYYEPHCDHQMDSFADIDSVDAVITPASDQIIAGSYPLVEPSFIQLQTRKPDHLYLC